MQASGVPTKFPITWAYGAGGNYVRQVPNPPQSGIAASFYTGFPGATFAQGGAPSGLDGNGALKMITAWDQWVQAGGPIYYDASFSSAGAYNVGGYPAGALLNAVGINGGYWFSTADNNVSDPDAGGANWLFCQISEAALDQRYLRLSPSTTFYVSPSGNDSNPGTSSLPFLTPQGAVNSITSLYAASSIMIECAANTSGNPYPGCTILPSFIGEWNWVGAGASSCFITSGSSSAPGRCFDMSCSGSITGFTFSSYYENVAVQVGHVLVSNCNISAPTASGLYASLFADGNGLLEAYGTINASGGNGTGSYFGSTTSGIILFGYYDIFTTSTLNLTIDGSPTMYAFAFAFQQGSLVVAPGVCTFSGTMTGYKFDLVLNGTAQFNGSGQYVWPGSVAGETSYGGQWTG